MAVIKRSKPSAMFPWQCFRHSESSRTTGSHSARYNNWYRHLLWFNPINKNQSFNLSMYHFLENRSIIQSIIKRFNQFQSCHSCFLNPELTNLALGLSGLSWCYSSSASSSNMDRFLTFSLGSGYTPLTGNIIMEVWKIIFLWTWVTCRFHLDLPGCNGYIKHIFSLCPLVSDWGSNISIIVLMSLIFKNIFKA